MSKGPGKGRELARLAQLAGAGARNLALGANLQSLRLLGSPRRLLSYASENLFLYRALANRLVPEKTVAEVLGAAPEGCELRLSGRPESAWFGPVASYVADIVALCSLARLLDARTVFEIGTSTGYTAFHFALNTPADARVYTLDLPRDAPLTPELYTTWMDDAHIRGSSAIERYCFTGTSVESRITPLFGDSARFDYSPWHGRVDLFFIDGAHSYEYVRADTDHALKCVRPGGAIAWHDFGRVGVNGVTRCIEEVVRSGVQVYAVPGGSVAFALLP